MQTNTCPFCEIDPRYLIKKTKHCAIMINLMQVVRSDALLVVPLKHIKTIEELDEEEFIDFFQTIKYVRRSLADAGRDKFNILINE